MAGAENIKPFAIDSAEKAREMGRIGGMKSGEAKRKRKALRQAFIEALSCDIPRTSPFYKKTATLKKNFGMSGKPTVQDVMVLGQLMRARTSTMAAEFIRDTIGEKPTETFEDLTPQSPIVLGTIPLELVRKAKEEHDKRQLDNNKRP